MLVHVKALGDYHIMGESLDDAVGEAFDKTAKMLGLGYPGGPVLAALADSVDARESASPTYTFPRPMVKHQGLDFSFSGLKTFALTSWQNSSQTDQDKAKIAHAFQEAVVDTLFIKCRRALKAAASQRLVIAGGVGANKRLRKKLQTLDAEVFFPRMEFCTDNGAMIAYAGAMRLQAGQREEAVIQPKPRWSLEELAGL
jgi:N6-L-threonylcarbamoyladenine synthase